MAEMPVDGLTFEFGGLYTPEGYFEASDEFDIYAYGFTCTKVHCGANGHISSIIVEESQAWPWCRKRVA
jgi:hypothetical protein